MVRYSRAALAVVLALALGGALIADTIIDYITLMISTVLTGLLVAAVLGRFWRRATWQDAVAAIAGGAAVATVINMSESLTDFWGNPVIPSLIAAIVAGVLVSIATPRTAVTREEALRRLAAERAELDVGTEIRAGDEHEPASSR